VFHRLTATVEITFQIDDDGFQKDGGDLAARQLTQEIGGSLSIDAKLVDIRKVGEVA
jgi:hypothetical protein